MADGRASYLVQATRCRIKRVRTKVYRLRENPSPRQWRFEDGACVVGHSLSDCLEAACALLGVKECSEDTVIVQKRAYPTAMRKGGVKP